MERFVRKDLLPPPKKFTMSFIKALHCAEPPIVIEKLRKDRKGKERKGKES